MSAITIELSEAEAIVSDLDEAISEILDLMLTSSERARLTDVLMKIVSARYLVRCEVLEAFKARDKQEGPVAS